MKNVKGRNILSAMILMTGIFGSGLSWAAANAIPAGSMVTIYLHDIESIKPKGGTQMSISTGGPVITLPNGYTQIIGK
jgi:hypothetical protein